MQVSDNVKAILESSERTNVLATSNAQGETNVAAFGSPMLVDGGVIRMMLGDNRSLANLKENPSAALLVMKHGKTGMGMEGCRLYLKAASIEDQGEEFDLVQGEIRKRIGDAAGMLKNLVKLEVVEARPIVDFGQGV